MKTNNLLIIGLGAAVLYFLFKKEADVKTNPNPSDRYPTDTPGNVAGIRNKSGYA